MTLENPPVAGIRKLLDYQVITLLLILSVSSRLTSSFQALTEPESNEHYAASLSREVGSSSELEEGFEAVIWTDQVARGRCRQGK